MKRMISLCAASSFYALFFAIIFPPAQAQTAASLSDRDLAQEYSRRIQEANNSYIQGLQDFQSRLLEKPPVLLSLESNEEEVVSNYIKTMEIYANAGDVIAKGVVAALTVGMIESKPEWPHDKCQIKLYALEAAFNGSAPAANALATMHKRGIGFEKNKRLELLWSLEAERRNPFFERLAISIHTTSKENLETWSKWQPFSEATKAYEELKKTECK